MGSPRYGMVGWQEFASNRTDILAKYDPAKSRGASRPFKTEHGVTGEAAFREWLSSFLPAKYRVTSGFIIPDVVETPAYKLYHYDIIIFDALNAVLEIKAAFGASPARDALDKLREFNLIPPPFPAQFSSAAL